MSETKFTPGPWKLLPGQSLQEVVAPSKNGGAHKLIASLTESPFDASICEANARLIASAPELLAALEFILQFEQRIIASHGDGGKRAVYLVKRAVAKATGKAGE